MIIALTTVSCGKEASLSLAIDDLNYDSLPAKSPRPTKPVEKLHAAVVELKELLAVQSSKNLTEKQAEQARKARAAVASNLAAVEKQFAADRKKLGDLEAKDALKRLAVIEGKTDEIKSDLLSALALVPKSGEKTSSAPAAIKQLTALSPDKPQQPLSSDLSFGIKNAKPRSVSLSAGITPAYQAPSPDTEPSSLPRGPEPADLEETDETKITPAIEQLATELDHDPVKIYEYVRNNVKFEPYYGIRKGADQTLAEKAGSDADQAALLIALMRESGVPARFVQGVAELPAAKAASWLRVDVANGERIDAVPEILWSGGIPTTPIRSNGELTKVRFGHTWAAVFVSAKAYRGIDEGSELREWRALDPSIKSTEFVPRLANLQAVIKPATDSWIASYGAATRRVGDHGLIAPSTAQMMSMTSSATQAIEAELNSRGIDESSGLSEIFGSREIAESNDHVLPLSTAFKSVLVHAESRTLPTSMRSRVQIVVESGRSLLAGSPDDGSSEPSLSFTAPTASLGGKRLTLGYVLASSADGEIVDEYHGLLNAPAYAAAIVPVLRVDGRVVARGSAQVGVGDLQDLRITYRSPGIADETDSNQVAAGGLTAVSLGLGKASAAALREEITDFNSVASSTTSQNVLTDDRLGRLLSLHGEFYFLRNDSFNSSVANANQISQQRQLSGATASTDISISYVGGFPVSGSFAGLQMDVDNDAQSAVSLLGGAHGASLDFYSQVSGAWSSSSESEVFEKTLGIPAASTTSVMARVAAEGIPLYAIDQSNVHEVLGIIDLGTVAEAEIAEAVHSGKVVSAPESEVTIGGWTGSGYLIRGEGGLDYRLVGGASGGVASASLGDLAEKFVHGVSPGVVDDCSLPAMTISGLAGLSIGALVFFFELPHLLGAAVLIFELSFPAIFLLGAGTMLLILLSVMLLLLAIDILEECVYETDT